MATASPWVIEVTDETFARDCIERSHELPVVVDFWAPWCGPCRMLGPVLEKLATEEAGKFLLAKVNVDNSQAIAGELGVSSIPAVFALRGGKIVDQFVGVLPEADLRRWLAALEPTEAEKLLTAAHDLEKNDPQAAAAKLRAALELAPQERGIRVALARVLLAQDRLDDAEEQVKHLASQGFLEPEAEQLQALCKIRLAARQAGDLAPLHTAAEESPQDMVAQMKLAYALAGAVEYRAALDRALGVVQKDRRGQGEAARQLMVDICHAIGPDDPLVTEYRRKLSAALY